MPLLKQIAYYFSVYKKYIGSRLYIVFALSTLAAVTEGFGIALLLPLIEVIGVGDGGGSKNQSEVKASLQTVLNALGIGDSMIGILFFIGFVFLIKGLIVFSDNAYHSHLKSQLLREIKSLMFDQYSNMDYGYYSRRNTGHFINVINDQIAKMLVTFDTYKVFLSTSITTIAYLGVALLLAWNFALMALGSGLFLLFFFRLLNRYVHKLSRKTVREQTTLNKFLVQTMQSFKYLVSTAQISHLRKGVMKSVGKLSAYIRSQGIAQALTMAVGEPVSVFFILLVIIIQITVLEAPLAPIFVVLVLFNRAMGQMIGVQSAWQRTLNHIGSLESVEREFGILEKSQEPSGKIHLKPFEQGIELRQVSFSYGAKSPTVLDNITLTIHANTTVAFMGESGAGKSTLVDMLTLLLKPRRGEILIDGNPSSEVDLRSWRSQIGYVSQETVVFDDTIANNICMWKGDYDTDDEVRRRIEHAARQAYAERFIRQLPQQFNTLVGDRGVRLSGGQRQRLFLARELYKNPRLLILDEATSSLDSETEHYIQESIAALKGSTTVVIIAHRLSTIKNADYIYVLDNGRIIEQGTHGELAEKENGTFSRMVALQNL
jgi:ABC-type multidrug transport system fused ATPase/permease subunit